MSHTFRNIAIGSVVVVGGLVAWESLSPIKGLGGPVAKAAPCSTAFVPGVQYVGAYGSGYVVVVGGKQIGQYTDLPTAQNAYNAAVCPGG